jgi:hypothetical protein
MRLVTPVRSVSHDPRDLRVSPKAYTQYSESTAARILSNLYGPMSAQSSKPIPFKPCEECCGPNGYHSAQCSRAKLSIVEKFESGLTLTDFTFLRELRIGIRVA